MQNSKIRSQYQRLFFCLSWVLFCHLSCQSPDQKIDKEYNRFFEKGDSLFAADDYQSALRSYQEAQHFRSTTAVIKAINRTSAKINLLETKRFIVEGKATSALGQIDLILGFPDDVDNSDQKEISALKITLDDYFLNINQANQALDNRQAGKATEFLNAAKGLMHNGSEIEEIEKGLKELEAVTAKTKNSKVSPPPIPISKEKDKTPNETPKTQPILTARVRLTLNKPSLKGYSLRNATVHINNVGKGIYKSTHTYNLTSDKKYTIEIRGLTKIGDDPDDEDEDKSSFIPQITISFNGREMIASNGPYLSATLNYIGCPCK